MRAELTLLLPGIAGPQALGGGSGEGAQLQAARALTEALDLPGLSALLEYARVAPHALQSPTSEGLLAEAFTMPCDAQGQWCAGAVARQGALGDAGDRYWMRADPVHLRADMGRLLVFPAAMLDLDLAESSAICEWMNAHEHFPGPELCACSGSCWLVETDAQAVNMRTFAPSVAHGQDADRFLPAGEGAARWHARMNEMQMLLNQCPINQAREARGEAVVNSVWFWGAGALPTMNSNQSFDNSGVGYAQVHGDNDLLAGLADRVGLRARTLPADGAHWLQDAPVHGTHLLLLEEVQLAACAGDVGAWQQAMHALDQRWLQPLAGGLRRGLWQRITIHGGHGASVVIARRKLTRWLRRRRRLDDVLASLRQASAAEVAAPGVRNP